MVNNSGRDVLSAQLLDRPDAAKSPAALERGDGSRTAASPAVRRGSGDRRRAYMWLALGAVLFFFANGRWAIPVATWLAPIFIIRFMRQRQPGEATGAVLLVCLVVDTAVWWQVPTPQEDSLLLWIPTLLALPMTLVFVADRLLTPRLGGFAATLVFPLAWTCFEFLTEHFSPLGSWGLLAYTQYGNLPLMQVVSLTGSLGLGFMICWLGPLVNWAWERGIAAPGVRRGLLFYGALLALLLLYGGARLSLAPGAGPTVRVAGFNTLDRTQSKIFWSSPPPNEADFRRLSNEVLDRSFAATEREASAGAKIVLWQEGLPVLAADEAAVLGRAQQIARERGIYLFLPLYVFNHEASQQDENKVFAIDPAGQVAFEHFKYGGSVFEGTRTGDQVLRTVESPYGRLSSVICWDGDFPLVLNQAGRNDTDIMLVPAFDWAAIDPMHARNAVYRAIENGFSLVRQTGTGLSLATDAYGRVLAEMDHFRATDPVLVAQVPTAGVPTLYSLTGDLFGWLAVAGFLALAGFAALRPHDGH